jgi:hypothetical protein
MINAATPRTITNGSSGTGAKIQGRAIKATTAIAVQTCFDSSSKYEAPAFIKFIAFGRYGIYFMRKSRPGKEIF